MSSYDKILTRYVPLIGKEDKTIFLLLHLYLEYFQTLTLYKLNPSYIRRYYEKYERHKLGLRAEGVLR